MTGLEIETIKCDDLELDNTNARIHDENNIRVLAASLQQFGQRKPIVITATNIVVAGNGTLQAAQLLGWEHILCVRVPIEWSIERIQAYALTDNRTAELAEWDTGALREQLDSLEALYDIESLGFASYLDMQETSLVKEFKDFSGDLTTTHQCPKCKYEWNGANR